MILYPEFWSANNLVSWLVPSSLSWSKILTVCSPLENMLEIISIVACLSSVVHSRIYETRFDSVTWDDSNWRLTTSTLNQGHYQARAVAANGYIGINVAALGPFFEVDDPVDGDIINEWPLFQRRQTFATVAGFFDEQPTTNGTNFPWLNQYGGESVISGIPHWSSLAPECGGSSLHASTDASQITAFSSTWDFKAGTLNWAYTWTPPNCPAFDIRYSLFTHKLNVHQAVVQMQITSSQDANVTVHDGLDGTCAVRSDFVSKGSTNGSTVWTAVHPDGLPSIVAYIYSTAVVDKDTTYHPWEVSTEQVFGSMINASSIAQSSVLSMKAGQTSTVHKFIGIASSDAVDDPQTKARDASAAASNAGYLTMLRTHMKEWGNILTPDSLDSWRMPDGSLPNDPNLVEQQILAVSNPYSILQNTVGDNAVLASGNNTKLQYNSVSVGGLGSDTYGGLIFWDAEVWMQPGIVTSHPEAMKGIANYRVARHQQALDNIKTAYQSSQNTTRFSPDAALYSWTSGRFGNCTGTGPCFDYEYHLNGDIALSLDNYYAVTGDTDFFREKLFPVYNSAAQAFSDLLYLNETTHTYMLHNATDPDEFANMIDNPAYTMLLMQTVMNRTNQYREQFDLDVNDTWMQQAQAIEIPVNRSAGIHLEYSTMNGTINVKQADVVLIYDLLNYQSDLLDGDLNYYAGKQSLDGPGMTYGVFSIVTSEASTTGCSAYTYDLWSSQPYARAPWFQYSEQLIDNYQENGGFHPAYPFLTGMGGASRVPIYGYLGLRLQQDTLNINPTLPPQIPYLNYRTFYWQGHAINATSNSTHTTIVRLPKSLNAANPAYLPVDGTSIPVTIGRAPELHNVTLTTPLVITNRQPHLNQTVPGNLAQCLPVTSDSPYQPGQFPLSAVDGAISTKWQPMSASTPASMTVALGDAGIVPIRGFAFDWAQAPPLSYRVDFSNSSDGSMSNMVNGSVTVSDPYDLSAIAEVVPYRSNTTNVTLANPVMGGRFATLTIVGNQAFSGMDVPGGSVAEWAILADAS